VSFKSLYRAILVVAISVALLDYLVTLIAFANYPVWLEANVWIRLMMAGGMNPYLAVSLVFVFTLGLVIGSYLTLRSWLSQKPYSSNLRQLGSYLWTLNDIRARDLAIFACLALIAVFVYQHAVGLTSWLWTFARYGL